MSRGMLIGYGIGLLLALTALGCRGSRSGADLTSLLAADRAFEAVPDMTLDWVPVAGGVAGSGDLGWTWGTYTATYPGPDGEMGESSGKYLNVWVMTDDGWRVRVDMGNAGGA